MAAEHSATEQKITAQASGRSKSAFMLALLLFSALNCYLAFNVPFQLDEYKYFYRSWAWWSMNDLRSNSDLHNVALLGSSLMVSAIAGCDANYTKKGVDLTQYHRAQYLDKKLRDTFGGDFNTFNLALPGQVPSDAYLALRSMVNCAHRPDVVIYGIAPRDFLDSTLNSPVDTEPFQYFKRLVHLDDVAYMMFRTPLAKLDWFLQRHVYLYGTSMDFRIAAAEGIQNFLAVALPAPAGTKKFTWWDRTRLLPQYLPGELIPNAVMTDPVDEKTAATKWKDNTAEYRARYKHPDELIYKTQIFFLKQMAAFCKKERIELIVVNMPITRDNAMVLKPQVFNNYLQAMKIVCFENGIAYFDLCNFEEFKNTDFYDTVHMNAFGGRKFVDLVVKSLTGDWRSSSAMSLAGAQLQRYLATRKMPVPITQTEQNPIPITQNKQNQM